MQELIIKCEADKQGKAIAIQVRGSCQHVIEVTTPSPLFLNQRASFIAEGLLQEQKDVAFASCPEELESSRLLYHITNKKNQHTMRLGTLFLAKSS